MRVTQTATKAAQRPVTLPGFDLAVKMGLMGGAVVLALAASAVAARSETITVAHGISTFGELKYPADFMHLAYVNPDAPKGGNLGMDLGRV